MSPMPDFSDSVERFELDQNLNTDDTLRDFDRKISVSEVEKSNLSVYASKESKSSDTERTEKTTLMRENSVDTLASKSLNQTSESCIFNNNQIIKFSMCSCRQSFAILCN